MSSSQEGLFTATSTPQKLGQGKTSTDIPSIAVKVPVGQPTVYFGGSNAVNTTTGWPITPTATAAGEFVWDLQPSDELWCVAVSSSTFNIFRTRHG